MGKKNYNLIKPLNLSGIKIKIKAKLFFVQNRDVIVFKLLSNMF